MYSKCFLFFAVDLRRGGSTGVLPIPPPPDFVSEKLNTLFSPLALFQLAASLTFFFFYSIFFSKNGS